MRDARIVPNLLVSEQALGASGPIVLAGRASSDRKGPGIEIVW